MTSSGPHPSAGSGDPFDVGLGDESGPRPAAGADHPAGAVAPGSGPAPARPTRHRGRTIGRSLALTLLVFVTVLLVLFVVFNTQSVDISLVFADIDAPLVLALAIAAVLGGLVVALTGAVLRARRRNR